MEFLRKMIGGAFLTFGVYCVLKSVSILVTRKAAEIKARKYNEIPIGDDREEE